MARAPRSVDRAPWRSLSAPATDAADLNLWFPPN
jgi:hypothetical protein